MPTKMNGKNLTVFGLKNPGDFAFSHWVADPLSPTGFSPTQLHFVNPVCRFNHCSIHITRGEASAPRFHWDGNLDAPTITPSIGCDLKPRCGWHGHITNGEILP